jgi:hypothetical protein
VDAPRRGDDGVRALRLGLTACPISLTAVGHADVFRRRFRWNLRLILAALALAAPAPAAAQQVARAEAVRIASGTEQMRAEQGPRTYLRARHEPRGRWVVSMYVSPSGQEQAQVHVDDRTGRVLEAWTGVQARWPMARGYPGAFGRAVNRPWIWIGLSVLFALPFLRGPPRMLHVDVAVLLAFGLSYAAFNAADIDLSVPTVYPLLAYLLARMLWVAWHPPPAPRLRASAQWLLPALMFLIGVRIALNVTGNVIDVGTASVIGADRLAHGEPLYGAFPATVPHGDTYGPVTYAAYVPFELLLPPRAAAHAAALAFDLGCLALLWRIGGLLPAYLWASYPFTALVSASGSNDALVPLLLLAALITTGAARGALAALAGLAKLAPLALAPLLVGRRPVALLAFAVTFVLAVAPFDLGTLYDRTVAFQAERDSPFSIWADAEAIQRLVQVGALALALLVAFVPRRRDLPTIAALAAAVLIALQLGADHWFYLYLVWFVPLMWLALLGEAPARSRRPAADSRSG